jgi:hypothetical protein
MSRMALLRAASSLARAFSERSSNACRTVSLHVKTLDDPKRAGS